MGKFQKKSATPAVLPASTKPAKSPNELAAGYKALGSGLSTASSSVVAMQRSCEEQARAFDELDEARRREADTYAYNQNAARQLILDSQAKEDAEREATYETARKELAEVESFLLGFLGIMGASGVAGQKAIETALQGKIDAAVKIAEGKATAIANKAANDAKALDAAMAKTASALLEQKNAQLIEANAALTAQNKELLATQSKMVEQMKDLAGKGFEAAGAIQGRGMASLENASSAGAGLGQRSR